MKYVKSPTERKMEQINKTLLKVQGENGKEKESPKVEFYLDMIRK